MSLPFILGLCALLGLPVASEAPSLDAPALATRAQALLKTACYRCHGQAGVAKGGFSYVLDRERLVARNKLVPGNAAESKLFRRVASGEMPPRDQKTRLSPDEVAVLKQWIDAGAPALPGVAAPRAFLADAEVQRLILADLRTLGVNQRRFARYFTLTHLYNADVSEEDLETVRQGVSKLVNSLSWHPRISRPHTIDPARTILRIDLRHYQWNSRVWDRLAALYPYRISSNTPEARAIATATGTDLAQVRADWFLDTAVRPPLYHDILQLPGNDRELERLLRVDVLTNIDEENVARAGFNDSGVSRNNRLLERHDASYGAYWRTYDFSDNTDRQNIFEHPLGPAPGRNSFAHAGGEIIFHLPNGLEGYFLVNGNGQRVDRAPIGIVSDPKRPDRIVETGISCVSCHVRGFLPKADQVRAHVEKNPNAFSKADTATVQALYPREERFRALVEEDAARYVKALARAGVTVPDTDPISAGVLRYESVLDLAAAAGELGLRPDDFARRLSQTPALARALGALQVKGGTVQRQTFLDAFPDLVREFRLAQEQKPLEVALAGDWQPFSGHTGAITCLVFAPDGRRALSGSEDRTIRLWDVATGRELRRFEGHGQEVTALAFSQDGRRAVSGSRDRTVRLWDVDSGRALHVFKGHTDKVRAVTFAADGLTVLSGGQDRTLRLWDVKSGGEVRAFTGHSGWVSSVAFAPDGQRVLSGSYDKTVRLWDVATGRECQRLEGHAREVYTVAFAPDGKHVASGGNDRTVRIWLSESGKEVRCCEGHANAIIQVAFTPDGRQVLSGSSQYQKGDRIIRLWDVESGKESRQLVGATVERVGCLAFTADGQGALSTGSDPTLRFWKLSR